MNATALYRALVDAGAKEDLAKEAAESVVYSPEGATKSDLIEVRTELKGEIAGLELRIERSLRVMTWRFVGLLLATQALLFAGLRLTGTS